MKYLASDNLLFKTLARNTYLSLLQTYTTMSNRSNTNLIFIMLQKISIVSLIRDYNYTASPPCNCSRTSIIVTFLSGPNHPYRFAYKSLQLEPHSFLAYFRCIYSHNRGRNSPISFLSRHGEHWDGERVFLEQKRLLAFTARSNITPLPSYCKRVKEGHHVLCPSWTHLLRRRAVAVEDLRAAVARAHMHMSMQQSKQFKHSL